MLHRKEEFVQVLDFLGAEVAAVERLLDNHLPIRVLLCSLSVTVARTLLARCLLLTPVDRLAAAVVSAGAGLVALDDWTLMMEAPVEVALSVAVHAVKRTAACTAQKVSRETVSARYLTYQVRVSSTLFF